MRGEPRVEKERRQAATAFITEIFCPKVGSLNDLLRTREQAWLSHYCWTVDFDSREYRFGRVL